jgi:hypothetical protein
MYVLEVFVHKYIYITYIYVYIHVYYRHKAKYTIHGKVPPKAIPPAIGMPKVQRLGGVPAWNPRHFRGMNM